MAKILSVKAKPILDSRGDWTVEVDLKLSNGRDVTASVPHGKSVGSYEAVTLPAAAAVKNIKKIISPRLKKFNSIKQEEIDGFLIKLDGTVTKKRLGANAILAVSIACAKAGAYEANKPLWKHIRGLGGFNASKEWQAPRLFANVINGGLHAGNNLDFQEYLVIPKAKSVKGALDVILKLYSGLGDYLIKLKGKNAVNVGDEGGFTPNFKDNLEPFYILDRVARKLKVENKIDFGLDAAASDVSLGASKLNSIYKKLESKFHLFYLEDPFGEDEFGKFAKLKETLGGKVLIVGDDLTTTNLARMEKARNKSSVNAVIVKPNQIGTVTESIEAAKLAYKFGWQVVVSHRSGETNDDFIADFAWGVRALGLKLGAPARGERIAKYNRLLEIETE